MSRSLELWNVILSDSKRFETLKVKTVLRRVGMELPTIEVRYEGLKVEAECEIVEGKALPTLWNTAKRVLSVSIFSSCCYLDSVIASKRLSLKFCFIAFLQELVKLKV